MAPSRYNSEQFYERLFKLGQCCQRLVKELPKKDYNSIYGNQLIRSSSSPGANYLEALEAASRRDFINRLRICRKEARESVHWLRLIHDANLESDNISEANKLIVEAREIVKMLTASIITSEKKS